MMKVPPGAETELLFGASKILFIPIKTERKPKPKNISYILVYCVVLYFIIHIVNTSVLRKTHTEENRYLAL